MAAKHGIAVTPPPGGSLLRMAARSRSIRIEVADAMQTVAAGERADRGAGSEPHRCASWDNRVSCSTCYSAGYWRGFRSLWPRV